jgi:cell division protein FtsL
MSSAPARLRPALAVSPAAAAREAPRRGATLRPLPGGRLPGGSAPGGQVRRHPARLMALGVFVVVAICMFGVVGAHALLTQNQFRLDTLQRQLATVSARHQQLEDKVGQLAAPSRILWVAEHDLGMVAPASVTYVAPPVTSQGASAASHQVAGASSP